MGFFSWRKKKDNGEKEIDPTDVYARIEYFTTEAPGARRTREVAAEEARRVLAKMEKQNEPQMRLTSVYQDFKAFMTEIEARNIKKQNLHQEQQETNNLDRSHLSEYNWTFSASDYDIRPPSDYGYAKTKKDRLEEQIGKYENLCAKGYIDDATSRKLILPYILEKKKIGQPLTQSEQETLDRTDGDISKDYAKAVLMLQTIGLINSYEQDFPQTSIGADRVLAVRYFLYPNKEINGLFQALATEAGTLSQIDTSKLSYYVRRALQEFKADKEIDRRTSLGILSIAEQGLINGFTTEDVLNVEANEISNTNEKQGGKVQDGK